MDQISNIQRAIDYIEDHLEGKLDYADIAKQAYVSSYHFQRVFGILCGHTLGEYIRNRRLSRAAMELLSGEKVLDTAIKYGYESSESFSRAFQRFHGALPSEVKRGCPAKIFQRLSLKIPFEGAFPMNCKIEEKPAKTLVGYKTRFHGVPYGQQRLEQEHEFYSTTRGKQWLLIGAAGDLATDYAIVTNIDDDGYDFYIAYEPDEWTRGALFDPSVTGMNLDELGFEVIELPKRLCAVFATEQSRHPISEYTDIRQRIVTEWLPQSDYQLAEAPEVVELHWRVKQDRRSIEITLPIIKTQ